jgi:excisionase family DNA binding protein
LRIDPVPLQLERLLVRISEAAAILACERKRIYKLFDDGEIETIGHGASRRVVVDSLRAYVEREREIERGRRRGA